MWRDIPCSTEGASFDSPGRNPGFEDAIEIEARSPEKGVTPTIRAARFAIPASPIQECRPVGADNAGVVHYPGFRCATPWAIECDPFGVGKLAMTDGWGDARNILCVRLDSLGDVLMTTPAMRALKVSMPGRRVTLLTSHSGAAAAALVPDVDDTIVYEAPWMKHGTPRGDASDDARLIGRLRTGGFEAAVIFTVFSQNPLPAALVCYLAEIPLRLAHCRENPYRLLTDWVAETEPHERVRHETRRQLDLVAAVGARTDDERLRLRVPPAARQRVRGLLAREGLTGERPWAVIHPGATAASRRYPPGHFAEVAWRLTLEHGWRIVYTGDASEAELVTAIRQESGVEGVCWAGRLKFDELSALIEAAPLVIANNTGPVHVAAAVGTPVIDLYALTNPQHTPWLVPHRVLSHDVPCKYCYKSVCPMKHHDCLRLVSPEAVVHAALELREEALAIATI